MRLSLLNIFITKLLTSNKEMISDYNFTEHHSGLRGAFDALFLFDINFLILLSSKSSSCDDWRVLETKLYSHR